MTSYVAVSEPIFAVTVTVFNAVLLVPAVSVLLKECSSFRLASVLPTPDKVQVISSGLTAALAGVTVNERSRL
ncbi:hypothetical protein D3C73_1636060 [compost metagenome]